MGYTKNKMLEYEMALDEGLHKKRKSIVAEFSDIKKSVHKLEKLVDSQFVVKCEIPGCPRFATGKMEYIDGSEDVCDFHREILEKHKDDN